MNQRQQIYKKLIQIRHKLQHEKAKQIHDKQLIRQTSDNATFLSVALLSSVYMGWQLSRSKSIGKLFKRLVRYVVMSSLAMAKTKFIVHLKG